MGFLKRLFRRKIAVEDQLDELAACGIGLNRGVSLEETLKSIVVGAPSLRAEMESKPYRLLVEALGGETWREPYPPMGTRVWMLDSEIVEHTDSYKEIVERLEFITDDAAGLTDIKSNLDEDSGVATVAFSFRGQPIEAKLAVDNDWLDCTILFLYDQLLEHAGAGRRLYTNPQDYGQALLVAGFSTEESERFAALSPIRMTLLANQDRRMYGLSSAQD